MLTVRESSEQNSPKRVTFGPNHVEEYQVDPINLSTRLSELAQDKIANHRYENDENYEKPMQIVKEVNYNELENKYNRQNNDEIDYKFGKRLRSQERLELTDEELRNQYTQNNTAYNRRIPKSAEQQTIENTSYAKSIGGSSNSFQMKNIVKNTEYMRKKAKDSPSKNTTIPEVSSKYEESRDETTYSRISNNDIRGTRSRSPFSLGETYNTDSHLKTTSITYSPPKGVYRTVHDRPEYYSDRILTQRQSNINPMASYEVEYTEPIRVEPIKPYVQNRTSVSPKRIPAQREVRYQEQVYERPEIERVANVQRVGSPRHASPRETRSPRRASVERRPRDSNAELDTLSRFFMNNLLLKTVEDLVFELVPEFVDTTNRNAVKLKVESDDEYEVHKSQSKQHLGKSPPTNRGLMSVMKMVDNEDGNVSDSDDTDERSNVNKIIKSKEKKEFKNNFYKGRYIDSLGVLFEGKKEVNGVKSISYQESKNLPMINVKPSEALKGKKKGDLW